MSGDPARFLNAFAQALAAMALYRDGHPARERALDVAYQQIQDLQAETARPLFTSSATKWFSAGCRYAS